MSTHSPKKGLETIGEAAARLLAKMERSGKKVAGNQSPEQIQSSTDAPRVEKEAGEIGAYSSLLTGHVLNAANDNRRFGGRADFDDSSRIRGFAETTARPTQDDGSVGRSRGNIWLLGREGHALGEW